MPAGSRWSPSRSSSRIGDLVEPARDGPREAGGALAGARAAVDGARAHVPVAEPGHDRPRPPERPLPRLRGPDGLHAARDRCAALWRLGGRAGGRRCRGAPPSESASAPRRGRAAVAVGPSLAIVGVVAFLAWNVAHQPPAVHPDGGFPAADGRGRRGSSRAAGDDVITLVSLPDFKSTEAYGYPLDPGRAHGPGRTGGEPIRPRWHVVVICDSRFEVAIGAPCGGPAEATVAPPDRFGQPVDRFVAAPDRTISIYQTRRARGPLRRSVPLGAGRARRAAGTGRPTPGIANAGAPDAGVRCPETRIVEGESGPCPGVC